MSGEALEKLGKSDPKQVTKDEWQKVLDPHSFDVTRNAATEPPKTGKYDKFYEPGKYLCKCCGADLFISDSKYDSGCGWPAFDKSIDADKNIVRLPDNSYGYERTEVRCKVCDAHLGHVFDGQASKTGERYCINSVAINFLKKDNPGSSS